MNDITFEQKILNIMGKKNYDKEVIDFVHELNEELNLGLETFGLPADRLEYGFQNIGLRLMFDKMGRLVTVYIHFVEEDGYKRFNRSYNKKINPHTNRHDILDFLGKPTSENLETEYSFGMLTPKWMVYDYPNYTIHYEFYGADDELAQITIMLPDIAPGRKKSIK